MIITPARAFGFMLLALSPCAIGCSGGNKATKDSGSAVASSPDDGSRMKSSPKANGTDGKAKNNSEVVPDWAKGDPGGLFADDFKLQSAPRVQYFDYKKDTDQNGTLYLQPVDKLTIEDDLKDAGENEFQRWKSIDGINRLVGDFNNVVRTFNNIDVPLSGLDALPSLPKNRGELYKESVRDELGILRPSRNDYMTSPMQVNRLYNHDGSIYPLSVVFSFEKRGFPVAVFLRGGMSVKKESIKKVRFIDANLGVLRQGIYLELIEPPIPFIGGGPGGTNGIIVPIEDAPFVIVNRGTKEVHKVGFDAAKVKVEKYDAEKIKIENKKPDRNPDVIRTLSA